MTLSIIIPFYNTKLYTDELLNILVPQLTNEVECVIIDDGSYPPYTTNYTEVKVIRQQNGGPAKARNTGIENTTGKYIQFIDSDDIVSNNFVEKVLEVIYNDHPDMIVFSWKSLSVTGTQYDFNLAVEQTINVPSVVTRTFKRVYIGNVRFNENKDAAEDEEFSRKVGYAYKNDMKVSKITDYLYFYRTYVSGSNSKRYQNGLTNTKRIIYYIPEVTSDRIDILESIKKDDMHNEVLLMTNKCDIPELKKYCQIFSPCDMWTHLFKGSMLTKP